MNNTGSMRLVLGGSGYGKSSYIFDNIIQASVKNPDRNYIVVVPEQFTMATQKEIVERHPNHGVLNIDIVSFNRLAFRVFEELGISSLSVLDDTGKTLILKRIIEENRDKLNIYKNKAGQAGFVEEMKSAISELYSYGIDLESFEAIVEKTGSKPYISSKLRDISVIYSAFREALGDRYITKEEILEKLCGCIGRSEIIKNSSFVFDGFTGFTPVQNKLLGLLLELGLDITVAVTISGEEAEKLTETGFSEIKEQELFNLSKTTINKLFALAADKNIAIRGRAFGADSDIVILDGESSRRYSDNEELGYLEKNIFRDGGLPCDSHGSVKVLSFDNPIEEAQFAATYINNSVRNEGFRYRDFAVITGDMEVYRKLIETAFTENDIPFFMDNKRKLILNPCVAAIRAALKMVREDFSYESVFSFLRCGMTDIDADDIDILENYVLEYGIRGYRAYSRPFVKLKRKRDGEMLRRVNEVRESFAALTEEFRQQTAGKNRTVGEFTRAVYEFGERMSVYERLKAYEESFNAEGRLALGKEYSQTYGLVIELYDKLSELMGDTIVTLKEYEKLLEAGFEEIKVGVIPLNIDTVVVGDMERTRLADIRVLLVVGVNDGIIPKTGGSSGLLTQRDRGFLKRLDVELSPTARESIFIQRFYLYQNLTKPSDRLILTYSLTSADGRSQRQSYLIGNVLDMYADRDSLGANELHENVFTREMGLKYVSRHFGGGRQDMSLLERELYAYFYKDKELRDKLLRIVDGAYFSYRTGAVGAAVAEALYGDDVIKSASRLERYAACAYAHFLSYGLKLAERKIYEISAADIGTLYHRVIELFSKEMKQRGYDFRTITDESRESILEECVAQAGTAAGGDVFMDTERNKYLLNRIKEVSSKTIWAISEHIKSGKFNPEDFELSFSDGRIDRVDTMDSDGRYYVKIIDYKSGNKKFDIEDVMNGLQIQLIYYMGAVMEIEKKTHGDRTVMPAGAFYFNIKSPYIERIADGYNDNMTAEERELLDRKYREAMLAEYRMTGLVNSDSEAACNMDINLADGAKASMIIPIRVEELDAGFAKSAMGGVNFTHMIEYVRNQTERMCDEILGGNIEANPYKKGTVTPCAYCAYKEMCTFNEKYAGGKFRTLNKFKPEDIYKRIGGEGDGSDVDGRPEERS